MLASQLRGGIRLQAWASANLPVAPYLMPEALSMLTSREGGRFMTRAQTTPTRERPRAPVSAPGRVGEHTTRSDGVPKVKGEFEYSSDLWMDGMLWGATLRSPHPHARSEERRVGKE